MSHRVRTAFGALAILVVAIACATWMLGTRRTPRKAAQVAHGVAVEVEQVQRRVHKLDVLASGVVVPARSLDVHAATSARIQWLHEGLVPGTLVDKGQLLFRLDAREHRLARAKARSAFARARSQLKVESGRQRYARRELSLIGPTGEQSEDFDPSLALRAPQLTAVRAEVGIARATLRQAKLELSRTKFRAPFAGIVTEPSAEVGQLATPQLRLFRLIGTESFWVRVSVRVDQLPFVAVPGVTQHEGSLVRVLQTHGKQEVERSGRVIRLLSRLEPASGMASLLVEVKDPYGLEGLAPGAPRPMPLLLDTFTEVRIAVPHKREFVELSRDALRSGDRAYVVRGDKLEVRDLEIAWHRPASVLVSAGLADGDRVIVSPLSAARNGMLVREVSPVTPPDIAQLGTR